MSTMVYRKTAISIPEEILNEIDSAARQRGWSRSRFIAEILRRAVRARRDARITRRLNDLFADETLRERQRQEAGDLAAVSVDWEDESW